MKKILLSLVAIMLATVARAADGDTFGFEGIMYTVLSEANHTAAVAENKYNKSNEVNIPNFVTRGSFRYIVTQIGERAFYQSYMTSVTIPNSVTQIGENAFYNCRSMTSVTIPNSVTQIGENAFYGCSSLTSVTIPSSVNSLGYGTFANCTKLEEIIVEDGNQKYCSDNGVLYNIAKTSLYQCPGAKTEYEFPSSVVYIGNQAFEGCSNLTSVTIPNSVTKIYKNTFSSCSSLTSVTIPNSVTEIGDGAFFECSSLPSVTIPNSVTKIGHSAFSGCSSLISVTIPNSVTWMGYYVFARSGLTSVTIPNSLTEVCDKTFEDCTSLTSVTIPKSVTWLLQEAFHNCTNLTKIIDLNPTPQHASGAFYGVPSNAVVYIPKGSYMAYMFASDWTQFSDFREMGAFDITLSESTLRLSEGESAELTVTVVKDDDMTIGDHEWTSSNPEVATVEGGKVTAVALGTAEITYTVYDGYGVAHSESCKVTVAEPVVLVESITLDRTSIEAEEGSEVQLTVTVTPDDATNKEIAWSSSDEAVATVSATGLVKILKAGTCVITAATTDGSDLKAECTVTGTSGIEDILSDNPAMADVYTTQGVAVLRNASAAEISALPAGLYIVRQGNEVKKIAVK
ncbi:MAG: leucine-rich repeat protein [Duncaniella sp.]|nr:leucine-rich repeat protein [Duncaniella sp.]